MSSDLRQVTNLRFTSPLEVKRELENGPVHFNNCDFTGLNLITVSLDGCKFDTGCNLTKVLLGSARRCEFWHSNLTRLDLRNSDIRGSQTTDCLATGILFFGQQMTFNCNFLKGLKSPNPVDGYRLIYWAALADTPLRDTLLALIPPDALRVVKLLFDDPARGLRINQD